MVLEVKFSAPAAGWKHVSIKCYHFQAPQAKIFRFLDAEITFSKGKINAKRCQILKFSPAAPSDRNLRISRRSETRGEFK